MIQPHDSHVLRRQRLKVPIACQDCRARKAKCDGGRPTCSRCQARGTVCHYTQVPLAVSQVQRKYPSRPSLHAPVLASPPSSPSHSLEAPTSCPRPPDDSSNERRADSDYERSANSVGRFAGQVTAAIDKRAGLVPAATAHQVPFVDAPLFGDLELPLSPLCAGVTSTELPLRSRADHLVDIYWRHIDPVEPILGHSQLCRAVNASYSATVAAQLPNCDIWLAILNLVFALAVQRQEPLPRMSRDDEANRYFRRAWALLPAESLLWRPASLELVQCLMLMNRYLHCTNNQHKTWITAGLVLRTAQSMCCHMPKKEDDESRLRRKVWASCVALDRCVSWSLGRSSAQVLVSMPPDDLDQDGRPGEHPRWQLELHEIGNQIQLAQVQSRNSSLGPQEEYHAAAIRLDACLDRWEKSLASDWQLHNLRKVADRTARMERYLLHLRLLHARIYLYRPMLSKFYATKTTTSSLSERLLREYASMCVEAAQHAVAIVAKTLDADTSNPIGLLPWWYRIYYLHIAGVIFLAAMVRSDLLFTDSVARSWKDVLTILRSHTHLSTYVQQCVCTFETLAARIRQTRCAIQGGGSGGSGDGIAGDASVGASANTSASASVSASSSPNGAVSEPLGGNLDMFQDIEFDFDDFLFGTDDVDFGALR